MAGKFPLTYTNQLSFGTPINNESLDYILHTEQNTSIFTPESPAAFDVYTFATGGSDSPRESYSLFIIKNMGGAASHVRIQSINFINSPTQPNVQPFTFVTNLNQISVYAFEGSSSVLSPDDYDDVTNRNKLTEDPIGYLRLDQDSGDITETSFGGTAERFIPFWNPKNREGSNANTDTFGMCYRAGGNAEECQIGAKEIAGVTYPEYAAFMIKCAPTEALDVNDIKLRITYSNPAGQMQDIVLKMVSYSIGDLSYTQGWYNTETGAFQNISTDSNTVVENSKLQNSQSANFTWGTVSQESGEDEIIAWLNGPSRISWDEASSGVEINNLVAFDSSVNLAKTTVCLGFYPYGVDLDSQIEQNTMNLDLTTQNYYVKIYDNTPNTGGVRFISYHENEGNNNPLSLESNGGPNSTNTSTHVFTSGGASKFVKYQRETNEVMPEDLTSYVYDLVEDDVLYAKIERQSDHVGVSYRAENAASWMLHPDTGAHFSSSTHINNRRVIVHALPMFYMPFWVSYTSAISHGDTSTGSNGEQIHRDTLYITEGDYYVWSTNATTAAKFCRLDSFNNLTFESSGYAAVSRYTVGDETIKVTENIGGVQLPPTNSGSSKVKEENNMGFNPAPDGNFISTDGSQPLSVWKHKHIFDYFVLPGDVGDEQSLTGTAGLQVQFNNFSGLDGFFCSKFYWTPNDAGADVNVYSGVANTSLQTKVGVNFTNDYAFRPNGVTDYQGNNGLSEQNILTVFKGDDTTFSWTSLPESDGYLPGAKKKMVHLGVKFSTNMPNQNNWSSYSGDVEPTDTTDGTDPLGRSLYSTSIELYQAPLDMATGLNNQIQRWLGDTFYDQKLTFWMHARAFTQNWRGFSLESAGDLGDSWEYSTLYVTQYAGVNKFGTHSLSGNNRTAWSSSISKQASQERDTESVMHSTQTSVHSLATDGYKGIKHQYAAGYNLPNADYYYRKYPLNGSCTFKYERYFSEEVLYTNTTNKYGILPGPLAEGRFIDGVPDTCYTKSNYILESATNGINEDRDRYECFIPFNISNDGNYQRAQIVSIDLENKCGTAGTSSVSPVWGDPRELSGSNLSVVNGTESGVYRTALHPQQNKNVWSAPYPLPTTSDSDLAWKLIEPSAKSNTGGRGRITVSSTVGIIKGMLVYDIAGGNTRVPSGMKVHEIVDGTTIDLSHEFHTAGGAGGLDAYNLYFDHAFPDYVIWDIVEKKEADNNEQLTSIYHNSYHGPGNHDKTGFEADSNGLSSGDISSVHADSGDRTSVDLQYVDALNSGGNAGRIIYGGHYGDNVGLFDSVSSSTSGTGFPTNSLYKKYSDSPDGPGTAPVIYFAIDNTKMAGDEYNNIPDGWYINRLRIRYILHDKLDNYGVNQKNIGPSSETGYSFSSGNDGTYAHVYEDTRLIAVYFSNMTARAEISDIEGNVGENNGVPVDFGVIQTG